MLSGGAVAELRSADSQLVGSVFEKTDAGLGAMLRRRSGIVHGVGDAPPDQPVIAIWGRHAVPARQGATDNVDTLVEPIAADLSVACLRAQRDHGVARFDDVALPQLERIH